MNQSDSSLKSAMNFETRWLLYQIVKVIPGRQKHTQIQKNHVEAKIEHICSNITSVTLNKPSSTRLLIITKSRHFCKRFHQKWYSWINELCIFYGVIFNSNFGESFIIVILFLLFYILLRFIRLTYFNRQFVKMLTHLGRKIFFVFSGIDRVYVALRIS